MSEESMFPRASTTKHSIKVIDIPSISTALNIVNSEISNASQAIQKLQDASLCLDKAILSASLVNFISHNEMAQIPNQNLILAMSEIQDRMTLLATFFCTL
jgi:hypothetical protein